MVGATSDYVDELLRIHPGRAFFLTSESERAGAREPSPGEADEALCDLEDTEAAESAVASHLGRFGIALSGLTAFDCESLGLAARLAQAWSLPFPSPESVALCRDKLASKRAWAAAGLPCPAASPVSDEAEALAFWERFGRDAVLKPLTGSGSELVFRVRTREEVLQAVRTLRQRLAAPANPRMYAASGSADPRRIFAAEEFVRGDEYSCDFVLEAGRAELVRVAAKIPARDQAFGATLAYETPAALPKGMAAPALAELAAAAARALGMSRAFGMLDFIVRDGQASLIEMAPRPGGDCLPPLLRRSAGIDTLGLALDFAEGPLPALPSRTGRRLAGVRLFARRAGTLRNIDLDEARRDARAVECRAACAPGRRVVLPPDDYDSRVLGYVIFEPTPGRALEEQCVEMADKVRAEIEPR